jgi:hypothetical protein
MTIRLLALILFLTVPMMGQIRGYPPILSKVDSFATFDLGVFQRSIIVSEWWKDTSGVVRVSREYFVVAFLKFYDQYAKECYNDSTLCDRHTEGFNFERIWKLPRYYTRHRQPSFEGFIEWLRKQ